MPCFVSRLKLLRSNISSKAAHISRYKKEKRELQEQGGSTMGNLWPVQRQIDADNVGHRLLKKAGWSEGAGLGANEQVGSNDRFLVIPFKSELNL